jgi:hypothetical protein
MGTPKGSGRGSSLKHITYNFKNKINNNFFKYRSIAPIIPIETNFNKILNINLNYFLNNKITKLICYKVIRNNTLKRGIQSCINFLKNKLGYKVYSNDITAISNLILKKKINKLNLLINIRKYKLNCLIDTKIYRYCISSYKSNTFKLLTNNINNKYTYLIDIGSDVEPTIEDYKKIQYADTNLVEHRISSIREYIFGSQNLITKFYKIYKIKHIFNTLNSILNNCINLSIKLNKNLFKKNFINNYKMTVIYKHTYATLKLINDEDNNTIKNLTLRKVVKSPKYKIFKLVLKTNA